MRDEMFRRRVEVKLNEAVVLAIELDFVARIVLQLDRVIAVDRVRGVDESRLDMGGVYCLEVSERSLRKFCLQFGVALRYGELREFVDDVLRRAK